MLLCAKTHMCERDMCSLLLCISSTRVCKPSHSLGCWHTRVSWVDPPPYLPCELIAPSSHPRTHKIHTDARYITVCPRVQVEELGSEQRAAYSRWMGAHFESAFPRDWLDDHAILPKSKRSGLLHVPLMPDRGSFSANDDEEDT